MDDGIDAGARLDYATIQIFPTKKRYEIFVCGGDEEEKLAVGLLDQLLPHLPEVRRLNSEGSNAIFKLQVTGELHNVPWFTKSTLNRFLKIAGSPDLLNTSKTIEYEISQLEEARKFHLSLYTQGHQDHRESGETDDCDPIETEPTVEAEAKIVLSDASKNELLQAMDLRLRALKIELATALDHTFGATCSCKEITNLLEFCEYFGATDLKNLLLKLLESSQKGETVVLLNDDNHSSTGTSRTDNPSKMDEDTPGSIPVYSMPPVKYGVSPAKAAQVERESSNDSEVSSDSSDENKRSAERCRPLSRSAAPRRSASPMRRVQIGRAGSRRATALTIKSLNFYPVRERTSSHTDATENSSEEEGSEQSSKKPENDVRRMSVQDAINLFERKQKDQSFDVPKKSLSLNVSLSTNKSVLRRWSAGVAESPSLRQQELTSEDLVSLPCNNDIVDREISKNLVEKKLESDLTSGCQSPAEPAEVDEEMKKWEEKEHHAVDIETEAGATLGKERKGRTTASVEWSRQKEAELNQMLMKMMENQPVKTQKSQTVKKQNIPSEQRGGFYDHYREKRDRKIRGENAEKRAEKESQFRAMQQILDARKAEIATANVKDVYKKHPPSKPQNSLKSPQPATIKTDSSKSSVMKKVSSKTSTLPATRKSWPSTPPTRAPVLSPSKTPSGISSAGTTPRSRKPQSAPSLPRSNAKVERSQPRDRNKKETQIDAKRNLKGTKEKMPQTAIKSGKTTKKKIAAVDEDGSGMVPAKSSFYNKVARKSSVVPVESKPFLRKGSRSGPPIVNKTKDSSQLEEPSVNCGNISEIQDNEVLTNASVLVSEHKDQANVLASHSDAAPEYEMAENSHQDCGKLENFNQLVADGDNGFKDVIATSANFQSQEGSVISPSAWVEIEEQQDLPSTHDDGTTQLSPQVHVAPVRLPIQGVRHSLSQMLQEDNNSEPDTVEWGNAENPPAVVYQKDAPKGLKRLLKFARKSKGDANITGWSSPSVFSEGEDDAEEYKAISKRNNDNLLRKAALHSKDYGQQQTSLFEGHERNTNAHAPPSALSNTSKLNAQSSQQLHKSHVSTAGSTTKATRSFFSLSAFRGNKPNEAKFH